MTEALGGPGQILSVDAVASFVRDRMAALDLQGRSLCVVIPDGTRNCPLPLLLRALGATPPG